MYYTTQTITEAVGKLTAAEMQTLFNLVRDHADLIDKLVPGLKDKIVPGLKDKLVPDQQTVGRPTVGHPQKIKRRFARLPQRIFRKHEIPIADYLMSHQQALKDEYLKNSKSLEEAICCSKETVPFISKSRTDLTDYSKEWLVQDIDTTPDLNRWLVRSFKNHGPIDDHAVSFETAEQSVEQFPTVHKLMQEYGDDCSLVGYSILAPRSIINRHGLEPENRSDEFIRMHIPLIIPEGDCYFEVAGEIIKWTNLFGFNNQFLHSAHNNTDHWRLCFLIDIRRARAGLPPGVPYDVLKNFENISELVGQI